MIQEGGYGVLGQSGESGNDRKRSRAVYIMKVELIGFASGSNVG